MKKTPTQMKSKVTAGNEHIVANVIYAALGWISI
jgi:hypothetical protein